MTVDSGWNESAEAYIAFQDRGDPNPTFLLESSRTFDWAGIGIVNWHRPLSAYRAAYPQAGLVLRELLEPLPVDRSLRSHPNFEDWFRVPEFTVMKWQKPQAQ